MKTERSEVSAVRREVSNVRHEAKTERSGVSAATMKFTNQQSMIKTKGFTLIELMITIAIVAILATIAIPSFSSYLIRSKVHQLIVYAAAIKNTTSSAIGASDSNMLASAQSQASSFTGQYLGSISVNGTTGVITVTSATDSSLGNASNKTIIFTPTPSFNANSTGVPASAITWTCAAGTMPTQYLDSSCQ